MPAKAPRATAGEHDADWELPDPHRILAFEVKLAPTVQRVVNDDVEQAEGAVRALENQRSRPVRGLLVTPWNHADQSALDRLDRVRLLRRDLLVEEVERLIVPLHEYRRGWSEDAGVRAERCRDVEGQLPELDWLWRALERVEAWVERSDLDGAWRGVLGSTTG
jgi:hypothetical protein